MWLVFLFVTASAMISLGIRLLLVPAEVHTLKRKNDPLAQAAVRRREAARAHRARPGRQCVYAYTADDRLPRWAALDAAVALERLAARTTRLEIDIEQTVDAFVREPTQLRVHVRKRTTATPVVVWLDVEGGDHPLLQVARVFVDDLRKLGTAVALREFNYNPSQLRARVRGQLGPPESIEKVAPLDAGHALVIVSRSLFSRPRDRQAIEQPLRSFPVVVWFNLLLDCPSQAVAAYLDRLSVREVPLMVAGLRHFRSEAPRELVRPRPVDDEVAAPALACWALCAALVGNPTWRHLESFRASHTLPEIGRVLRQPSDIQRLAAWLERHCANSCFRPDGRGLAIPSAFAEHLIRKFREYPSGNKLGNLEARARQLIIEQLADRQDDDSWLREVRRALCARHAFALAPDTAWSQVKPLFGGMLGDEVRHDVSLEIARWNVTRLDGRRASSGQRQRRQRAVDTFGLEEIVQVPLRELLSGQAAGWQRTALVVLIIHLTLGLFFWGRWALR